MNDSNNITMLFILGNVQMKKLDRCITFQRLSLGKEWCGKTWYSPSSCKHVFTCFYLEPFSPTNIQHHSVDTANATSTNFRKYWIDMLNAFLIKFRKALKSHDLISGFDSNTRYFIINAFCNSLLVLLNFLWIESQMLLKCYLSQIDIF